jgi:hypothetical protein
MMILFGFIAISPYIGNITLLGLMMLYMIVDKITLNNVL